MRRPGRRRHDRRRRRRRRASSTRRRAARRPGRPPGARLASPSISDRVAGTGAQRLLEHVGRQLVRPRTRRRAPGARRQPVHVLEADRARRSPGRTPRRRVGRRAAAGRAPRSSRTARRPASCDREPHPEPRVGLDDRDVVARVGARRAERLRPWRTDSTAVYRPLAAAVAGPPAARRRARSGAAAPGRGCSALLAVDDAAAPRSGVTSKVRRPD